ncbi:MAG: tetratricopeptide repeat protein [Clostridiales bacterium]|nr:tetratricopeptide repeat protein [Clostridiales bacterium]
MRHSKLFFSFLSLFLSLLWLCSHLAFAQAGRGKGRQQGVILDEQGKPIASAKVVLELLTSERAIRETTTDKNGEWAFIGLGSGNWKVTASAEGYIPSTTTIFISQIEKNPKMILKLKKPVVSKDAVITDEASLAYLEEATKLYNEKNFDAALVILEKFLAENPKAYQVQVLIGDCYREKGDFDKAIEFYTRAVEEAKTDEKMGKEITVKGLAAIGDIYLRKGDIEKAQAFFKESIDTNPENETLAYNVGEIYFSNQKLDEAIHYFTIATQIKSTWSPPYYKLGLVYLNKAEYEKAKEAFKKFLELEPEGEQAAQAKNILEYLEKIKK